MTNARITTDGVEESRIIDRRTACQTLAAGALGAWGLAGRDALGQDDSIKSSTKRQAMLKWFDLPDEPSIAGGGRRIKVRDHDGRVVVTKVHLEIGERMLVIMPDGELTSIDNRDFYHTTTAPFRPATDAQVVEKMRKKLPPGMLVKRDRGRLYFYRCTEEYRKQVADVMESVHNGICQYLKSAGFKLHEPETPLSVVVFGARDEFSKFGEQSDEVTGFYNVRSNFTAFYEELEYHLPDREAARRQMLHTVAHEGVHQSLANIGVEPRFAMWPLWVSEGLPEYLSPMTTGETFDWKGAGEVNECRRATLDPWVKAFRRGNGEFIRRMTEAKRLTSDGYACAWALVHYLQSRFPASLMEYVRSLSGRLPMAEPRSESGAVGMAAEQELFQRYFGRDYAGLETQLFQHLRPMKFNDPLAAAVHYVAIMEYPQGSSIYRLSLTSMKLEAGKEWKERQLAKLTAAQRSAARFYHRVFPNRYEAETYASRWLNGN